MVLPGEMRAWVDGGLLTPGPPGPPAFRLAGELGDRGQAEGFVPQRPRALATAAYWRGAGLEAAASLSPSPPPSPKGSACSLPGFCPRRPQQREYVDAGIKVCFNQLPSRRSNFKTWSSLDQLYTPKRWPEVRVKWQGHACHYFRFPWGWGCALGGATVVSWKFT